MSSFDEFLSSLGGGAAERSEAEPWRDHMRNQAGGGLDIPQSVARSAASRQARQAMRPAQPSGTDMPGLPGLPDVPGSSSQPMFTQSELERVLDPRLTEGLQTARGQFESAQSQARALDLDDEEGEPPQGLLNSLFRTLDLPRAAVFNAARGVFDPNMGFEEFVEAVDEREGFNDLSALEITEDDSGVQRVFKGVAGFAGDVLTDPLTLVSFGGTSVGKRLGAEAVQKAVSKRAVDQLPESTIRSLSRETFSATARREARKAVRSDEAKQALQAIGKTAAETTDTVGAGSRAIGDLAASAYELRSATGLRQFLTAEKGAQIAPPSKALPEGLKAPGFGDEGRKLWESLPADMRGGLRIRVPFAREEGVRKVISMGGGGGQFAQAAGLGNAVEAAHRARGAIRATKAAQGFHRTMSGANGDLYGKMVADLVQGPSTDRLEGVTYGLYRTVRDAQQAAHKARRGMLQTGEETLGKIQMRLDSAGGEDDVSEAREAFRRWVNDPEALDGMMDRATGLEVDELQQMWLDLGADGAQQLTNNELLGLGSAMEFHHTLRHLFQQALDAGVSVDKLNDHYLPRSLTRAKREELAGKRTGPRRSGRVSGDDPTQRREAFVELVAEVDEGGVVRSRQRHLTPEQANQRARERAEALGEDVDVVDFFEEDPDVMLARYTQAMSHIASEAQFAKTVRRLGGVMDQGKLESHPVLNSRTVAEAQGKVDEAADSLRSLPEELQSERIREILSDVEQVRQVTHRLLNDVSLQPEEQVREVSRVFRMLDDMGDELPESKPLDEARKAFKEAAGRAREGTTTRRETSEVGEALQGLGLEQVSTEPTTRPLPPEIDGTFAPEGMREALGKFYEMRGPKGQSIADRWYRPYLSMFKLTATIGRGPGFHIRNVVGGEWNNHLIGVTGDDRKQVAKLVQERVKAGREARAAEVKEAMERTGASRRDIQDMPGFLGAVDRRAEEILRQRLGAVQVTDDLTLYDVHRMMTEHEIDWRPARLHAIADAEDSGFQQVRADQELTPGPVQERMSRALGGRDVPGVTRPIRTGGRKRADLFPGQPRTRAEAEAAGLDPETALSPAQRGVERLANLWWVRFNAGAAEMTEAYLRGGAFIQGLKRYGDPETAKTLPLATQFDYQDLSDFERRALRGSLLPFYTWTRHNVPLQVRGLIQQPGKMNRINHVLENAEEAFGDDDADVLPEWMRERFMFASRFKFDGNPLAFGVETPAQDLNEWFKAPGDMIDSPLNAGQAMFQTMMSATNPAFQVPMQLMTGTEFFTGARLDEDAGRHAPWWYERLPQSVAPKWVDDEGNVMGDGRIIMSAEGTLPWLNQGEKILAILGATQPKEGQNRRVSDTIRQAFPVVTAGTLTPQSESGELFQRAQRLRTKAQREADPEDQKRVRLLRDLGYDLDEISAIMERARARRERASASTG